MLLCFVSLLIWFGLVCFVVCLFVCLFGCFAVLRCFCMVSLFFSLALPRLALPCLLACFLEPLPSNQGALFRSVFKGRHGIGEKEAKPLDLTSLSGTGIFLIWGLINIPVPQMTMANFSYLVVAISHNFSGFPTTRWSTPT